MEWRGSEKQGDAAYGHGSGSGSGSEGIQKVSNLVQLPLPRLPFLVLFGFSHALVKFVVVLEGLRVTCALSTGILKNVRSSWIVDVHRDAIVGLMQAPARFFPR